MFGKLKRFLHRNLVSLDMFGNTLTGGVNDETISSRAQRNADAGNPLGKVISKGLDVIQKDHGHRAEGGDLRRAEVVEKLEEEAPK